MSLTSDRVPIDMNRVIVTPLTAQRRSEPKIATMLIRKSP